MVKKYTKQQITDALDKALAGRIEGGELVIKDVLDILEHPTIANIIEGALDDDVDQKIRELEDERLDVEARMYSEKVGYL